MLDKLKMQVKEIAMFAVKKVEQEYSKAKSVEKKEMAIEFVVQHLPVKPFFKPIVAYLLSDLIDDTIEFVVSCMNLLCEEKQ